jgi:hypothetical protein
MNVISPMISKLSETVELTERIRACRSPAGQKSAGRESGERVFCGLLKIPTCPSISLSSRSPIGTSDHANRSRSGQRPIRAEEAQLAFWVRQLEKGTEHMRTNAQIPFSSVVRQPSYTYIPTYNLTLLTNPFLIPVSSPLYPPRPSPPA